DGDRPRRNFGERSFGKRDDDRRPFGDRPRRDFNNDRGGDRPQRNFNKGFGGGRPGGGKKFGGKR
ncbi:MAG: RNA helicase, partial [Armatimonadetes bacterium]|nr:RNA helicase [Armatimonadota bacterium]